MKTIICKEPGVFEVTQTEEPLAKEGYTKIKIDKVGICGTDIHAFEGTQPYFNYPRILGHELAGEVHETISTSSLAKGDKVTVIPYHHCGKCIACKKGRTNCCAHMQVMGVHIDGGMRAYINVPDHLIIKDDELTFEELALVEPLSIGAHGVKNAQISSGDFVLVIGAGPIGLGTMEMARIAGANVIAMDINQERLTFCKEVLNIPHTIPATANNPMASLNHITNGDMPLIVFDCTGNLTSINNAFQYLAHSGTYILIGLQKGNIIINHPDFHKRELTLMSSRNATRADFLHVMDSIKQKKINPKKYITHQFSVEQIDQAFKTCIDPSAKVIKSMIDFSLV